MLSVPQTPSQASRIDWRQLAPVDTDDVAHGRHLQDDAIARDPRGFAERYADLDIARGRLDARHRALVIEVTTRMLAGRADAAERYLGRVVLRPATARLARPRAVRSHRRPAQASATADAEPSVRAILVDVGDPETFSMLTFNGFDSGDLDAQEGLARAAIADAGHKVIGTLDNWAQVSAFMNRGGSVLS